MGGGSGVGWSFNLDFHQFFQIFSIDLDLDLIPLLEGCKLRSGSNFLSLDLDPYLNVNFQSFQNKDLDLIFLNLKPDLIFGVFKSRSRLGSGSVWIYVF